MVRYLNVLDNDLEVTCLERFTSVSLDVKQEEGKGEEGKVY